MSYTSIKALVVIPILYIMFSPVVLAANAKLSLNNNSDTYMGYTTSMHHDHICLEGHQISVWCIDRTYNNREEPWRYKDRVNADFPWIYKFKFYIFDVQEVDDEKQTISISMYFRITWLEPRLVINETSEDWDDLRYGLADTVDISPELLKHFWNPDLEIYGMESFHNKKILKDMASLKIKKDYHIEYMARVDITFSCLMSFNEYPLDDQQCPFRIGSYYSSEDTVNCTEDFKLDTDRQRSLQYLIKVGSLPEKHRKFTHESKTYSICGFNIKLERTRKQMFYQVYLTSILFVVVSWMSFIIKPEIVPGRMALLVMIFLILINTFNSVKQDAPSSRTLNAVDFYLLFCIGNVFMALFEYAVVLFRERNGAQHYRYGETKSKYPSTRKGDKGMPVWDVPLKVSSMNKLDLYSLALFPAVFICFNVIYYIIHAL